MNYQELNIQYQEICNLISGRKINQAIERLKPLADECHNLELSTQLENQIEIYRNLLTYSFAQYDDPEKEKVYFRLLRSLFELADRVKETLVDRYFLLTYARQKRELENRTLLTERDSTEIVENLAFEKEIRRILDDFSSESSGSVEEGKKLPHHELSKIFHMLWLSDLYREPEAQLVRGLVLEGVLPWHDKCLVVSAITLSLIRYFDPRKIELLFDIYEAREEQVWHRAFVGLVIGLYVYNSRMEAYPDLLNRVTIYQGNADFERNLEMVFIQVIKSKETEKITRKFETELFPEMMKLRPRLDEKLDLENLLSDATQEDKNPDWQSLIGDSPGLYEKLEEFSMLQMEGSDVFLSAFALLKQFDFFREIGNWFVPFYKENQVVKEVMEGIRADFDADSFMDGLQKSSFICNSDKYSFCLNVNRMPALQKSMMIQLFNMEINGMNEAAKDDQVLNRSAADRTIFTQYFQDLYRFHKLFPGKSEFTDIFSLPFDLHNTHFYQLGVDSPGFMRNIGEFYFSREYYHEALQIFHDLDHGENNPELLQKMAFANQKLGLFDKAVQFYEKALLVETPGLWTLKKMAYCYRKLGQYSRALEYYRKAELLDPDDLQIQTNLGNTCLDMKDYDAALKYYFKVTYLAPDNFKVRRPLGWCSFVLGRFDVALKYFTEITSRDGNQHDYMNLGHVQWCLKNKEAAIENYKSSIRKSGYNIDWFRQVFEEDGNILVHFGIPSGDLPLMLDYLRFSMQSEWPAK